MSGSAGFRPRVYTLFFYLAALALLIFPQALVLHEREVQAVRMDTGLRAGWLARALWLRLEDARQEIPGVLLKTNWQGLSVLKWVPMPWAREGIQLVRQADGLVIQPVGGEARSPIWVLPQNEKAALYQALPQERGGLTRQPVPGLDALTFPAQAGQVDTLQSPKRSAAEARIFFERQRRLDGLVTEMDAILGQEDTPLAVLIASDGASVYARSRGLDIPALEPWLTGTSNTNAQPGKVRVAFGTDALSGLVVVDLASESLPALTERILLVLPLALVLLAIVIGLRDKMTGRGLFLFLLSAAILPALIFWNDTNRRQGERQQQRERIERGILEQHQHSDAVLARAAPAVWGDFLLRATMGIHQTGPGSLALLLILVLAPGLGLILFLYSLSDSGARWGLIAALIPLFIVGAVFIYSLLETLPEFRMEAGKSSFLLLPWLVLSLTLQTLLSLPIALAWSYCGRLARSLLLALVSLPLVAPLTYRTLLTSRIPAGSGVEFLISLLSGLPLVVLAMVLARSRIPVSLRKTMLLQCGSVWQRYRSLDLWVCLVGAVPAWALSAWLTLVRTSGVQRPSLPLMIFLSCLLLAPAVRLLPLWTRRGVPREEA